MSSTNPTPVPAPAPAQPQPPSQKRVRKGGQNFDEVWTYFIMGQELNPGHYKATCYHCNKVWARGKPSVLKAHLANECLSTPEDISKYWRNKLAENNITYTRTFRVQSNIDQHFRSSQPLPSQVSNRIDRSLLKAWTMSGISFEVIENPFIVDLFKELNPAYIPPSRTTLSGRLLDEKVARIQNSIDTNLENAEHLTLSMIYSN